MPKIKFPFAFPFFLAAFLLLPDRLPGQMAGWIGGTGSWFEGENWIPRVPDSATEAYIVSSDANVSIHGGAAESAGLALSRGSLSITGGGTLASSSSYHNIAWNSNQVASLTIDGPGSAWNANVGTGGVRLGRQGAGTINLVNGGALNITGTSGSGLLIIGEDGGTGILNIGAAPDGPAAAPGTLTVDEIEFARNGGTGIINLNHTGTVTLAADISGDGSIHQYAGTSILTGDNSYTGSTTVEGGTLQAGSANAFANDTDYIVNGGVLDLNDYTLFATSLSGLGGEVALSEGGTFYLEQAGSSTYAGAITGGEFSYFVFSGGGEWTLTGNSQLGGVFSVEEGTVISTGDSVMENVYVENTGHLRIAGGKIESAVFIGSLSSGAGVETLIEIVDGGVLEVTRDVGFSVLGLGEDSTSRVLVDGLGSRWSTGLLNIGIEGTGEVTLSNGGLLEVLEDCGCMSALALGLDTTASGILNIGAQAGSAAVGAGILNSLSIETFDGTGLIQFNHTATNADPYYFSRTGGSGGDGVQILGATQVLHTAGHTVFTAASDYTGSTTIQGGTLQTENIFALGMSDVQLEGGTLAAGAPLNINSLTWDGGTIAMALNASSILIDGNLTMSGVGVFDFSGINPETMYDVLTFATLGSVLGSFEANLFGGLTPAFSLVDNGDGTTTLRVLYLAGEISGPVIQNSAPVGTPATANFLVNGAVRTGGPADNNTVNSLSFNSGSSLQVFNNLTVTSGNFTVNHGSAEMHGGNVIVPGNFNKNGAGTLIANSNFGVGGAANINAGALFVNGRFTVPGGLTVFQSGLLGGSGIIFGNVTNQGVVNPGNSPGILTIQGNYIQTSSGTLQIEVASPTWFDQLVVSGNASLAGNLQVLGSGLQYGQQIPFLQAGSISGEFDTIQMPDASILRGRFLSQGNTGILVVAPTSYTLVAETTNQHNVAKALDSYIPARGNDREVVSTALDMLTEAQYPAAFDQIAPTFYESLGNITVNQAFAQTQMLNQRFSAVRLGAQGFQAIGIESPLKTDRDGKSVMESKDLVPHSLLQDLNWSFWAMGTGIFAKTTSVNQVPNYRFDSGGFLAGGDYRWSENFVTGVYGGYQYTWADYSGGGNTQINTALFGGYATYQAGGFYADAVVGGGYSGYRVRRPIEFGNIDRTASSRPDGGQFNSALNLGYDWNVGNFTLGPIAGVQYTYAGIGGFTETGADSLNLRLNQQNINSLRTTFGGRVAYAWNVTEQIAIIPEVRMFWQHEFLNNPRNIGSALNGGSGPAFGYETSTPGRDSVFAGAGLGAQFGERWNAFFYYNADFGRPDYVGHMISGGLNWKF